jgi:hypothetical protein
MEDHSRRHHSWHPTICSCFIRACVLVGGAKEAPVDTTAVACVCLAKILVPELLATCFCSFLFYVIFDIIIW